MVLALSPGPHPCHSGSLPQLCEMFCLSFCSKLLVMGVAVGGGLMPLHVVTEDFVNQQGKIYILALDVPRKSATFAKRKLGRPRAVLD